MSMDRAPSVRIYGEIETDHSKVTDAIASNIAHISSSANYDPEFLTVKNTKEKRKLCFKTREMHPYNDIIQLTEVYGALKKCHTGRG